MKKTHAKFHNNLYKTKKSCAHKRYQLFMYKGWNCLYIKGEKWLSSQCGKRDQKKWSNNYTQTTCTSSYHDGNICKVSKRSVQNCKKSCAHKTTRVNIDGWTNGQRYLLSIYWWWKMTQFTLGKKWQKQLHPNHMHILIPWRKHMQSFKMIGTRL